MGIIEGGIFFAVCFLAYSNGANDNFKGVATLFGSDTTSYRSAIGWATVTTLLGSLCSLYLAHGLLATFSGKGLVPAELVVSGPFVFAVALGAALTVMLAALAGLPISTTHSLIGALVGAGAVAAGGGVDTAVLGKTFLLPLLASPFMAIVLGAGIYVGLRLLRRRMGVGKELCICVGCEETVVALPEPASALALRQSLPSPASLGITIDEEAVCRQRYAGSVAGVNVQSLADGVHFLSAGLVSFARGLNDTPKIAALLLLIQALDIRIGLVAIALAMAAGGLLSARKVAGTMSREITAMDSGQGMAANLATAFLVLVASRMGLPVSTTHVSVGSLFGIGLATGGGHPRMMSAIAASWLLTLPLAAALAAAAYAVL